MVFLLYVLTAAALLGLTHRFQPLSRTAAILLLLLPFVLTGDALIRGWVYGPIDFPYATEPLLPMRGQYGIRGDYNGMLSDVASQMIPWRKAVQYALAHGQWPLHNPFMLCGDILAAAAQPAPYSPFTLIACLLPVALSFTYTAAITFFLAGLGAFVLARELGCREATALIASAGWMYSTDVSFFVLWPLSLAWAFLPLVLFGVRRVIRDPGVRSLSILTTALTLELMAGHPETALHVVFLGLLYALFELSSRRRDLIRALTGGLTAGLLSLLLCAIFVLPILEAAPQTIEHEFRTAVFARTPAGVPYRQSLARLATDAFPFLHVRHWRADVPISTPIDTAAVGSICLALAVCAVVRAPHGQTCFFAALAAFCLAAGAEWTPVARGLQHLPLFDVTLNGRLTFGAAFTLALLAALGLEQQLRRQRDFTTTAIAFVVLLVLAAGTVFILQQQWVEPNLETWGDAKIFAELAGLGAVIGVLLLPLPPRWTAAVILGLLLAQRAASERGVYKTLPPAAAYPAVAVFESLKTIREPFRVAGFALTLLPGMSAMYELEDPRGYEAMTLKRLVGTYPLWSVPEPVWFNRIVDLSRPFLCFLNVRYAVVWSRFDIPEGWVEVGSQRGTRLLENSRVLARAFVPRRVIVGVAEPEVLSAMAKETDFGERAWIAAPLPAGERENGPGVVTSRREGLQYEIDAAMERDGWVVISVSAWEGWRAYLDGRRVHMHTANTAFLSVFVPRGRHHIRLVYLPRSFVQGRAISFVTAAVLGILLSARALRRRRR